MTTDYKERIKKLSPASNKKFARLVDHIIEIIETAPSDTRVQFRSINTVGFPWDQQENMLLVLEDWGVLSWLIAKGKDDFFGPTEERFMVASLEILYQIRTLLSEMNVHYDPPTKLPGSLNNKELKKLLIKMTTTIKLGAKEKAFIKTLSDFKPHETKTFKNDVGTKDYKKLKQRVQKKLKGTSFFVNTIKGGSFKPSHYQLEYLPNSVK